MTEHKHTSGPFQAWKVLSASENHRGWRILGRDGPCKPTIIAEVYPLGPDPTPEAEANLVLFLAAPDLLKALADALYGLKWAADHGYVETLDVEKYLEMGHAAIAKARGE